MNIKLVGLLVCSLAVFAVPADSDAQGIKGLIKKKVSGEKTEQKTETDPELRDLQTSAQLAAKTEISEPVMEAFKVGIVKEIKLRLAFKKELAGYKTGEEIRACGQREAQSPEVQKIIMEGGNIPENATTEQAQKHLEKMQTDLATFMTKKCGRNIDVEWPMYKRQERLATIEAAGADAFVAALTEREPKRSGPSADVAIVGFAPDKAMYAALKDILKSFCHAFNKGMIILDPKDGQYKFSFSHPIPFSDFYDQKSAARIAFFCKMKISKYVEGDYSDDDLEDLMLQF